MTPLHQDIAALLPRLRRFARAVTRHREDADDLVQIAVERALGRSAQWEAGTRLDSWIFRIMKNAWIDEIRVRTRRDHLFEPEEAGEHVGDDFAEAHQQRIAIQKAISLLSEDHRLVIGLVLVDGLPYKEAADVLEIPIGTLTSRLARARSTARIIIRSSENGMSISDETLMAYADGELDASERNAVELAMQQDPAVASKVAQHQMLRSNVFAAFAQALDEPIPARLQALLQTQPETVVQLNDIRADKNAKLEAAKQQVAHARSWSWPEWGALAASLVVGVMVGRITLFAPNNDTTVASAVSASQDGGLIAHGKLATALSQQLASAPASDHSVRIGLSFVAKDGAYCRSFALDGSAGLACKEAMQWKIPVMVENLASDTRADAQAGSYRKAASAIPPAVLEAIDQRIAGQALDAKAEQLAKEHGWKP